MKTTKSYLSGSVSVLLLLISIFIYSCRKDLLQTGNTPPADVNLTKVKAWYQGKYPVSGKQTNAATADGHDDISQIIQPDWDAADVYRRGEDDVIELPAESGDYLIGLNNSNGKAYNPKYSHSSFVLLKNGENVNAYVMTVVADSSYINGDLTKLEKNKYNHRDENFSGLVIYSTPKGDFVSGWVLQNGIVLEKLEKRDADSGQANTRDKQNLDLQSNRVQTIEVCTAWYQWSYDENGNVVDYHYLDTICHTYYVDEGGESTVGGIGGSGTGSSGGAGGTGGGGIGTSPSPSPCKPVPVASAKGGLKNNLVRPPDDGFPNPNDPPPCPTLPPVTNEPIKNYGMDQNCLNCRIEIVNFSKLTKDLRESGTHSVTEPFNGEVRVSNGKTFTGKLVEIYYTANGEKRLLVTYFTPDINSTLFQTGIYYAIGNGGPDGTSNTPTNGDGGNPPITVSNGIIILPSTPSVNFDGNIFVYTRSGTTGTTAPSLTDVYTDPVTGITLKYADVENAFKNSAALAQIEAGEENISWPPISLNPIGLIKTQTFLVEYEILKLNNPSWPSYQVASVAFWNTFSGQLHFMLDFAGMIPVYGEAVDLINAGIYYLEGDKINCAYSAAAAMPVAGWLATGGKWVKIAVTTVPIAKSVGKNGYRAIKVGKELKLIKVAITALNHASLKTLKAIKPADATLTNLNAYLINTFGLRISPTSTTLKNAINDIIKYGDQAGTKMEKLADDIFATNGYQKFNSKIGSNNGFDAVYIKGDLANPTEIIINEAKQMSSVGTIKLNAKTQGGKAAQMSNDWINQTILDMRINSDPAIKNLGEVLNNNLSKITKTVSAVDKSTKEIVILRLTDYK